MRRRQVGSPDIREVEAPAVEEEPQEQESIVVEVPILETHVQVGVKQTAEGGFIMLNLSTVLSHDNLYALDRSQAIGLGSELLKMGRSLPSVKELEKVQRKLIVPS